MTIRGAREHSLRGVDLDLKLGAITIICGVSGSGKSSLAFDTLHAEGQRRYLEALGIDERGLRRPAFDQLSGLPPTIGLGQHASKASGRSSVGTASDIEPLLRVLFARVGTAHCPRCDSAVCPQSHDQIVAALLALPVGSRLTLEAPLQLRGEAAPVIEEVARAGFSRVRVGDTIHRIEALGPRDLEGASSLAVVVDRLRLGPDRADRLHDAVRTTASAGQGLVQAVVGDRRLRFIDRPRCPDCHYQLAPLEPRSFLRRSGVLTDQAAAVRWHGVGFDDLCRLPAEVLATRLDADPNDPRAVPLITEIGHRLALLAKVGLGRISLDRVTTSLSSGERQVLRIVRQLAAQLSGVLYVLDEPTAYLDDAHTSAVLGLLSELQAQGNTLLIVSHDPMLIDIAQVVVELGPGAGEAGGRVVFEGSPRALRKANTPTGRWLSGRASLPTVQHTLRGTTQVEGLCLPVGGLAAITGPTGAGKSRLLARIASSPPPCFKRVLSVDAWAVPRTARTNAATYTGLWSTLRVLLAATTEAQVRGLKAAAFSLNQRGGRCETCKGAGIVRVDLGSLPDVFLSCEVCEGRRFARDVLEVQWKGYAPDALLALQVDQARAVLSGHPKLEAPLRALSDVGLGYLPLGQPGHTLSGGEAHRLKLARELARLTHAPATLYLLDTPDAGLHPHDLAVLYTLLRELVSRGASVWLATHHPALIAAADLVLKISAEDPMPPM